MAVNSVIPPYPIFSETDGTPLEGGYIYVGQPGLEARSSPKASFFDIAMTVPTGTATGAAVRTTGGYPARNGAAAMIYVDGDFSVTVTDRNGVVVYTALNQTFAFNPTGGGALQAGNIAYDPHPSNLAANVQDAVDNINDRIDGLNADTLGLTIGEDTQAADTEAVINGDFFLWQRGTNFTANNVYTADKWFQSFSGGTVSTSRQTFATGELIGNNTPLHHLRQSVSGQSLAGHYAVQSHRIEGVRSLAGRTVTVLGYAKRNAGAGNMAIEVVQNFGTGGSPSAQVNITPVTVSLTGAWVAFAATFTIPSIAGKTIGSNGDSFLAINFWTSAGSTYNARTNSLGIQTIDVDISNFWIAPGTHVAAKATQFVPMRQATTFAQASRFYEAGTALGATMGAVTGTSLTAYRSFATVKRGTPTIAFSNTSFTNCGSLTAANISVTGFAAKAEGTNGSYINSAFTCDWTADADLNAAFA